MDAHKNEDALLETERTATRPTAVVASVGVEPETQVGGVKKEASKVAQVARPQSEKRKPPKNNVRKLRTERMMSKAELARRAGISVLTVDRVERGMSCRMDTKRKILEALGLKPQDRVMVFGDAEPDED